MIQQQNVFEYSIGDNTVLCLVTGEQWNQNTYIVTHQPSLNTIIIDPGEDANRIIQYIVDKKINVIRILLTHPHHDHVGGAAVISEYFNLKCELHKMDIRLLMHAPMYALRFANKRIPPVSNIAPFEILYNDETPALHSLHTPGHTQGSCCYIFDGFVMTGDTLLYKHIGRTDLPGGCSKTISASIEKLLNELPENTLLFPGHGKPWNAGEARQWWRNLQEPPLIHNDFNDNLS